MSKRRSISTRERARLFTLHGGKCHICGGRIQVGEKWEVEHILPWEISRDDSDENRKPAHVKCHRKKTATDIGHIARAKRREARHRGFKRPSGFRRPPGSKFNWQRGRYERISK